MNKSQTPVIEKVGLYLQIHAYFLLKKCLWQVPVIVQGHNKPQGRHNMPMQPCVTSNNSVISFCICCPQAIDQTTEKLFIVRQYSGEF